MPRCEPALVVGMAVATKVGDTSHNDVLEISSVLSLLLGPHLNLVIIIVLGFNEL